MKTRKPVMNEMELLTRLRDGVPQNVPSPRAAATLQAEISREQHGTAPGRAARARLGRPVLPRRSWLAALTGGLAAAAAAAVIAAQVASPGAVRHDGGLTVRELAYRTAAAAAAGPQVRPGQWVYWRQEYEATGELPRRQPDLPVWMTADATRAAYLFHGKLVHMQPLRTCIPTPRRGCFRLFAMPPTISVYHGQPAVEAASDGSTGPPGGVGYTALRRLPRSPQALDRYLIRLPALWGRGPMTTSQRAYARIEGLLTAYVLPPRLTAELYLALGDLPGITVDRHVVDLAGRPGAAFAMPEGWRYLDEIIVSRVDYRLLGTESVWLGGGKSRTVREEGVILQRALVPGPGISP
ncbi:MAG: CU044_5270 family protein [Streptosporangiaceae bacterium]